MPDRDKTGRFVAGNSANPGGRPKIPDEVREAIRAACPEAVEFLIEIMRNPGEKTPYRLDAIKTILDRAYGKPAQAQDITLDVAGSMDITAQIRRVLLEIENDRRGIEVTD